MQGTILSNRYLLAEEIGIGGMGSVYLATDLRTGGQVAVKIPHPVLARNPEFTERLRREAQIAASLYSPRIVRVMDLDITADGLTFLVMEYVPGETLLDELDRRGAFPPGEALAIAIEIARALDAAHQRGIVHRDLKPQNIKTVDGEVKVLDFGIAKAEGLTGVTATDVFMGTPDYSAPERAEGRGDIRSDIYSLGVMLYEMLAGRLPFVAVNAFHLIQLHESEPPPPLPERVPPAVAAVALRCLAKRPEDRYQTPRDLIDAIAVVLRGLPTPTAAPAPTPAPRDPTGAPPATPAGANAATVVGRLAAPVASTGATTDRAPGGNLRPAAGRVARVDGRATGAATRPSPIPPSGGRTAALLAGAAGLAGVVVAGAILLNGRDRGPAIAETAARPTAEAPASSPPPSGSVPAGPTAAITPVGTAGSPPLPSPSPTPAPPRSGPRARPLVAAKLEVEQGRTAAEREAVTSLNAANEAQILAYRTGDTSGLDAVFSGQALRDTQSLVNAGLRRQGRYAIANLARISLIEVRSEGPAVVVIRTREFLQYDEYLIDSDEPAPGDTSYALWQRWTYRLHNRDGRWLVDAATAEPDPNQSG